jgi:hypothetical protein
MFTLEPENLGQPNQTDRPAMAILKNLIPIPMPMLTVKAGNQVQFVAPPGFIYQPQFSTNITTGGWVNNGPSTNGNGEMVFSMSINSGQQGFYRVLVTRAP